MPLGSIRALAITIIWWCHLAANHLVQRAPSHNRLSCGAIWRQNRRLEDTYHVLTGKRLFENGSYLEGYWFATARRGKDEGYTDDGPGNSAINGKGFTGLNDRLIGDSGDCFWERTSRFWLDEGVKQSESATSWRRDAGVDGFDVVKDCCVELGRREGVHLGCEPNIKEVTVLTLKFKQEVGSVVGPYVNGAAVDVGGVVRVSLDDVLDALKKSVRQSEVVWATTRANFLDLHVIALGFEISPKWVSTSWLIFNLVKLNIILKHLGRSESNDEVRSSIGGRLVIAEVVLRHLGRSESNDEVRSSIGDRLADAEANFLDLPAVTLGFMPPLWDSCPRRDQSQ
ncbi:hypothetical protein M5K25_014500 [Dendrobium thyrsiflorum]|uniref:Uncharacterized protein n=1 Tax=Dendrobium thyrsiflorum TaxID=117978 RepID=A0ABD0UVW3_DENTH